MRTAIMIAAIVAIVAVADIGLAHWSVMGPVSAVAPTTDTERQFAIKFCYRQYTNQTDVNLCLLRNAHLASGETP